MWAVNVTEYCNDQSFSKLSGWAPAVGYMEAVWSFYKDLDAAPGTRSEALIGQDRAELMGLLGAKYLVPESSLCTRIGNDKDDGTIYVPYKGNVDGCYVCQYPVYTGESWEDALALVTRLPNVLVSSKLVPAEYRPQGGRVVTAFDGAYGCAWSKATGYMFLWYNPARALRILKLRARQEAGLWKPRKPGTDYYRLLMQCLRTVVMEHDAAFRLPRKFNAVLKLEQIEVKIVGKRANSKDDPGSIMAWVLQCHSLYRLMDRGAFRRLGRVRSYCSWSRPPMTYRKAIRTLVADAARMKACAGKHFKIKYREWKPFFAWVRNEAVRLKPERNEDLMQIAA